MNAEMMELKRRLIERKEELNRRIFETKHADVAQEASHRFNEVLRTINIIDKMGGNA